MPREARIHRLPMAAPDDVAPILAAVNSGEIDPARIRAILGKTEGNGCVNDFTRGFATHVLRAALAPLTQPDHLAALPLIMSGGTEGGLAPHWIVLHDAETSATAEPGGALAFASAVTPPLDPRAIGRMAQVRAVADAVRTAMKDAMIGSPDDVHFVQVKCPLLTSARTAEAGGDVATGSKLGSMGLSRGASALGIALALGEIGEDRLSDAVIGAETSLFSTRASCSSGIELMACEVLVLGHSGHWSGRLRIAHAVMRDAIDAGSVAALIETALGATVPLRDASRLRAVLAKAEASSDGLIRGARHTMLEDSDIASTRHARGFVGGMLAGLTGLTELFVSGGAEHQGPDGGGPCALIYEAM